MEGLIKVGNSSFLLFTFCSCHKSLKGCCAPLFCVKIVFLTSPKLTNNSLVLLELKPLGAIMLQYLVPCKNITCDQKYSLSNNNTVVTAESLYPPLKKNITIVFITQLKWKKIQEEE
ncbi:inhibitor of nuclear factor kappa-B kinase-interacting protein [Platysternon megacephalum]|uniref:Inhibitor of nuclear factor kappa-B kinase-interacting protein n=1 Tax=Platysternon megacephalum TaxID=55544 RepID=A0A4D9E4J7_9SAUR|nr:inhibitor of nuclear factor kappa-B kinase-interacting protein [Platysternon megacephalum]